MKEQESSDQAKSLLKKYLEGQCTPAEEQQVLRWFYTQDQSHGEQSKPKNPPDLASRITNRLEEQLFHEPVPLAGRHQWLPTKWLAAAMLIVISGFSFWMYRRFAHTDQPQVELAAEVPSHSQDFHNDILPGGHYANLTTPEGDVQQLTDPYVQRLPTAQAKHKNFRIDVPKAGSYMIILEDGTKVWLNASTQLSYPTHFEADQRQVSLTGEAYFEVAKDKNRPFRIHANGTVIEVLGTTFNVNAYHHQVSTSLIEGSVKVLKEGKQRIIKPGQQATTTLTNDIDISTTNLTENTAWQREEFYFDGNNFEDITHQIARWYNVEFENMEHIYSSSTYKGSISRNSRLSEVLQILALATGRKFDIIGRKVMVQ